jgi:hypothetical protein
LKKQCCSRSQQSPSDGREGPIGVLLRVCLRTVKTAKSRTEAVQAELTKYPHVPLGVLASV